MKRSEPHGTPPCKNRKRLMGCSCDFDSFFIESLGVGLPTRDLKLENHCGAYFECRRG